MSAFGNKEVTQKDLNVMIFNACIMEFIIFLDGIRQTDFAVDCIVILLKPGYVGEFT